TFRLAFEWTVFANVESKRTIGKYKIPVEFWMCHSLARILAEKGEEANAKSVLLRGEAEVVENPRPVYRTIKSGKRRGGLSSGRHRRRVFRHRRPGRASDRNLPGSRAGTIGLWMPDPVQWGRTALAHREADEEARPFYSPDFVAGVGPNQTACQRRNRARR